MTLPLPIAVLAGDTFVLALPFPSATEARALNPHAGGRSFYGKSTATKRQRAVAKLLALEALPRGHKPWAKATIDYRFYWPDLAGRDEGNYRQRLKGAVDGIVDAGLIVDDRWTVLTPGTQPVNELDRANPRVELVITKGSE